MLWILLVAIVLIACGIAASRVLENQRSLVTQQNREEKARIAAESSARAYEFESTFEPDWPVRWQSDGMFYRWYLMMTGDQSRVRIANVKLQPDYELRDDQVVEVSAIASAEIQQSSETVMKFESTAVTSKKGGLGRAAVGGVLFGGAGAVVGAVTAPTTSTHSAKGQSETRKGPIYLIIGTTDIHRPVLKIQLPSMGIAEEWLHRIRGAKALMADRG